MKKIILAMLLMVAFFASSIAPNEENAIKLMEHGSPVVIYKSDFPFYDLFKDNGKGAEGDYFKGTFVRVYRAKQIGKVGVLYAGNLRFLSREKELTKDLIKKEKGLTNDYESVARIYAYVSEIPYGKDHNAADAFYKHEADCAGHSKLFYRICRDVGIPCRCITGETSSGRHEWNAVKLNGRWYNVDTTWKMFLRGSNDFDDHEADQKIDISENNFSKEASEIERRQTW